MRKLYLLFCFIVQLFYTYSQDLHLTGLTFADEALYQSIPLASSPMMGELPPRADLTKYFPTPGNQGNQSSCVGWAIGYGLKTYQEHIERGWNINSDDHLFSPAYIYNKLTKTPDGSGGILIMDALNMIRRDGILPLGVFPYTDANCTKKPPQVDEYKAKPYAISDWRRVNIQDETEVKNQIAAGFPVIIGMMIDSVFQRLSGDAIYRQFSGQSLGGHAMMVIGYDDQRNAFKLFNSWGTRWGNNGYCWIDYNAFRRAVREGYTAQDIVVYDPNDKNQKPDENNQNPESNVLNPEISITNVEIIHNQMITRSDGLPPGNGMKIKTTYSAKFINNKNINFVTKFYFSFQQPLIANYAELSYRDNQGFVAAKSSARRFNSEEVENRTSESQIPYYALGFMPTNNMTLYNIMIIVYGFVENQLVTQSLPVGFSFRF